MKLVDSHAHFDLGGSPEEMIGAARAAGVDGLLAVGIDLASSRRAVSLAQAHPGLLTAVGVHPHDADAFSDDARAELKELAREPQVVAIGETGLDFYRHKSGKSQQVKAFVHQIELAHETGLTLVVHSREAGEETLEILESEAAGLAVIIHCFSLVDQVAACAERGYFMSLAGNVTFKKAVELHQAAVQIPAELLLTETDSPYLAPVPYRGKANQPAYVRHVLEYIAALRDEPVEQLADQVWRNFQRAFRLPY